MIASKFDLSFLSAHIFNSLFIHAWDTIKQMSPKCPKIMDLTHRLANNILHISQFKSDIVG